jgi:hypothetical protein
LDLIEIGNNEHKFFQQIIVKMQIGTAKRQSNLEDEISRQREEIGTSSYREGV